MSIVEIEYQVTGMTCGHCEMSVREEVEQVPGVTAIDVSATTGRLVVTADQLGRADAGKSIGGHAPHCRATSDP